MRPEAAGRLFQVIISAADPNRMVRFLRYKLFGRYWLMFLRYVLIVISLVSLAGCPGFFRLYIDNQSDDVLSSAYWDPGMEAVTIRPGKTGHISIRYGDNACFGITIGTRTTGYSLPGAVLDDRRGVRGGQRLDVIYEYGKMNFRHSDGRWVTLEEIGECKEYDFGRTADPVST